MDRDFNHEIAELMTRFGIFLETVTMPPIDLAALSENTAPPELANKLNALLADQRGTLPDMVLVACGNWVDAWFGAIVLAQNTERNPDAAVRQAAAESYTFLLAQMMGLQMVLDTWGDGEGPTVVME